MSHHPRTARWSDAAWAAQHFGARHRRALITGAGVACIALVVLLPIAILTAPGALVDAPAWLGPVVRHGSMRSATAVRADGVAQLATLLRGGGIVLALLAGAALLGIGLARATRQAEATSIHRAVGASRRTMRRAAVIEASVLTGGAAIVASAGGLALLGIAYAAWPGSVAAVPLTWLLPAIVGTPLAAIVLGSLLPLAAGSGRRVQPNVGPPLELHMAGGLLGLGAAAVAAALLLAPVLTPTVSAPATIMHLELPQGTTRADVAALLDRVAPNGTGIGLASAGTELGLGTVEQHVTDCGACMLGGLPAMYRYPQVVDFAVSPDTFQAIGARLVAGRELMRTDDANAEPVVVINQRMATDYFESAGAVGRRLQIGDAAGDWYRVVGVVDDRPPTGFGTGLLPPSRAYFPLLQRPVTRLSLILPPVAAKRLDGSTVAPAQITDRSSLSALQARDRATLAWGRSWLLGLGIASSLVAALACALLLATWLRGERMATGIQRGLGARRRRIVATLLARFVQVAAIATVTATIAASGFRSQLDRFAPGSASWSPGDLLLVIAAALVVATLAALAPSLPLLRWTPARLLGE